MKNILSVAVNRVPAILLYLLFTLGCKADDEGMIQDKKNDSAVVLTRAQDQKGRLVEYLVTTNRLQSCASWDGISGEPPLAISDALGVASRHLSNTHSQRQDFKPTYIALQRMWLAEEEKGQFCWFYVIQFSPQTYYNASTSQPSESYTVVILMDGSIVIPTQTNQSAGQGQSQAQ